MSGKMKNIPNAKALKRIEIAKEVLHLLEEKKIRAKGGYYIRPNYYLPKSQQNISCEVCAVGALVIAALHSGNPPDIAGNDPDKVLKILEPYFDFKQLALIEAAFEGNEYGENIRATLFSMSDYNNDERCSKYFVYNDEFVRARRMFKERDYNEILTEIMENIIHNDGEFVLGD